MALLVSVPGADDGRGLARRFSAVALPAAAVVVATGSFLAVLQTRSVDAVTDTDYGQLLVLKVLGVVALLALGWWSRRLVSSAALRLAHLLASVRAEVAVVAMVVAATAVLVNWVPARQALAQPVSLRLEAGSGTVQLGVEPAEVGPNDLDVYVYDEAGRPAAVDAVEVTATAPGVPERRLDVEPVTPDHFSVLGASLGRAGTWTVSVTTVAEGSPTTTTFEVPVR